MLIHFSSDIFAALLTPCVGPTPEYNGPSLVFWRTQNIVELHSEAVQVANVQWSKIVVECVVNEGIIDRKVAW
jgi:hypothetical protein